MADNDVTENRRLTTRKAAAYCSCSTSTLEKMRVRGDGPRYLKIRRRVAYDTADLDRWLKACRRNSTSENVGAGNDGKGGW